MVSSSTPLSSSSTKECLLDESVFSGPKDVLIFFVILGDLLKPRPIAFTEYCTFSIYFQIVEKYLLMHLLIGCVYRLACIGMGSRQYQ